CVIKCIGVDCDVYLAINFLYIPLDYLFHILQILFGPCCSRLDGEKREGGEEGRNFIVLHQAAEQKVRGTVKMVTRDRSLCCQRSLLVGFWRESGVAVVFFGG